MISGKYSYIAYLSALIFILTIFTGCGEDEHKLKPAGADGRLTTILATNELSKYISGFTSGEISKASPILIQFTEEVADEDIGEEISDPPISFDPEIDGKASWCDKRTLQFVPDEFLETATTYTCRINLDEIYTNVKEQFKKIEFQFYAIPTSLDIIIDPLKSQDNQSIEFQKLEGELVSSDYENPEIIENVIKIIDRNTKQKIIWTHSDDGKSHKFLVENIKRDDKQRTLTVTWDADELGIEFEGEKQITVYRASDFRFITAEPVSKPERSITLSFSDPLDKNQDLNGLIRIEGVDLKFIIDGNIVRSFPADANSYLSGKIILIVEPGIKNISGDKLSERSRSEMEFQEIHPQVQLIGKGVIAPKSNKVLFPFKAVNIDAVDVQIVKLFEKNIPQFLQVNNLSGSNELNRVAQEVYSKKIKLDSLKSLNLSEWNNFSLELSKLVNLDPGSIYRVSIGFRKSYSLYPGARDKNDEFEDKDRNPFYNLNYYNYGGYYDEGYDYDEEWYDWDYTWEERENPRHKAYYGPSKTVSRNIIASDLGIITKGNENGNMLFAVTDINTTKPLGGVTLEVYDYQNQLLKSVSTGSDGIAKVDIKSKPFLLIAKHSEQRGYLKLLDGNSLSLSRFDVSGKDLQKGIKGFIYGERGVWRPGDKIYLTFILEDSDNILPKGHPVSFDLNDSRGQLVKRIVKKEGVDNFYSFHVQTSADAPTGNYTAIVKVGGSTFTKNINVETIMPNRLKINLDLEKEYLTRKDDSFEADLEVTWLHGAVARNLKTTVTSTLSPVGTVFDKYKDYSFDNPTIKFESKTQSIFEGKLNEDGKAQIPINITCDNYAPGRLQSKLLCKVFEPGGAFSWDYYNVIFNPYNYYVGIKVPKGDNRNMLLTDKDHIVDIVTLNVDGKPAARNDVKVKVYKIDWRWWWDNSRDNLTNYNSRELSNLVTSSTVTTNSSGKGRAILRINRPEWGRFLIVAEDPDGHSVAKTVYIDWPGWARKSTEQGGETMLTFSADKEKYSVGDKVTLQIPGAENSRALISLESGSKVIDAYWAEIKGGTTKVTFEATASMAPNVYAHVTLVQPHAQITNDLPIRMYGVIPITVENPRSHLQPKISMPSVLRPESGFEVKVSEVEGREMTYTLAVVDEGLLDITKFKTPDPWKEFYSREALKVKTWDIYDEVIGYNGREFDVLLAIGGSDEGVNPDEAKINRFKPVVKFLGPFHLDDGEIATHKIDMPMYVGSVKTMVVAGYEGAYGKTEKTTPVKKPLMLIGTLPRVLGPKEELEFFLSVFGDEKIKDVDITIDTGNLIEVEGDKTKRIHFSKAGDMLVGFPIKVKSKVGTAKIKAKAKSGSETAEYNFDIEIRNPNTKVTKSEKHVLQPGETWSYSGKAPGIEGTNSGKLEVSSLPPVNLESRLDFLISYPHGCVEQTTSAVFPQLILDRLVDLTKEQKENIEFNIREGIEKLKRFQLTNGGLTYWPGSNNVDIWGTNYAGHFMLEAEKAGYKLPENFKKKWTDFQRKRADLWDPVADRYDLEQAYRLYLLALGGQPNFGAMNRFRETESANNTSKWLLAAAYYLSGQKEIGRQLAAKLNTQVKSYRELGYTYGSDLRDRAIILLCMKELNYNENSAFLLAKNISDDLCANKWWSTQSVGYSLLSLGKYYRNLDSKLNFQYQINGGTVQNVEKTTPIETITLNPKTGSSIKITITNKSKNVIFPIVTLSGVPQIGEEFDAENNLKLDVKYKNLDGQPINIENLEHGTDFYADVTVRNPGIMGDYPEIALTQIFPSGWEIHNSRLLPGNSLTYDIPEYQDIRDDRVYTYFDLGVMKSKTFRVMLNASYTGKFYLPAVYVETMYETTINAQVKGKWVNVVKK